MALPYTSLRRQGERLLIELGHLQNNILIALVFIPIAVPLIFNASQSQQYMGWGLLIVMAPLAIYCYYKRVLVFRDYNAVDFMLTLQERESNSCRCVV